MSLRLGAHGKNSRNKQHHSGGAGIDGWYSASLPMAIPAFAGIAIGNI
jgi:hypothetical protein